MTQEEKARAYDEALERARELINKEGLVEGSFPNREACETIFPELAESEDERIRKELLDCLRNLIIKPHEKKLRFMAWLEGLNFADLNLMKEFNKGMQEALIWGREGYEVSPDGKVKSLTQNEIDSVLKKQKEQKPAEWSEKDEAMMDNILRVLSCFIGSVECESASYLSTSYPLYRREMDWLKSLRGKFKED